MLRYFSVCSGIEATTVAWHPLGWTPIAFCEIEPFPAAVLKHHYPTVPNLGDMTKINGGDYRGLVDVLVGGTPCQAFSVAGLRKGLVDPRGNLTLVFAKLADDMAPPFIVWENVPGVLSSKDNAFGCFLGLLAGEDDALVAPGGKWTDAGFVLGPQRTIAWRVQDAQYHGLAQRRRRVFVVACPRGGADPREILFELEGVQRHSAPSREAGQGATLDAAPCLRARSNASHRLDTEAAVACITGSITHALKAEGFDGSEDGTGRGQPITACRMVAFGEYAEDGTASTLKRRDHKDATDLIAFPANLSGTQCAAAENISPAMGAKNPTAVAFQSSQSGVRLGDTHATLDSNNGSRRHNGVIAFRDDVTPKHQEDLAFTLTQPSPSGGGHPQSVLAFAQNQLGEVREGEVVNTLNTNSNASGRNTPMVAMRESGQGYWMEDEVSGTLRAEGENRPSHPSNVIHAAMQVRRLTPRECERLQGFPDDYTNIPWKTKNATVPVVEYVELSFDTKVEASEKIALMLKEGWVVDDIDDHFVDGSIDIEFSRDTGAVKTVPVHQCPDGPRYKALGNSMAVPCMAFIGRRIQRLVAR